MRRLLVILFVALLAIAAGAAFVVSRPYLERPALLKDPWAVNDALVDAAVMQLAIDVRRVDLLAEANAMRPRPPHPPQLCRARVLRNAPFPPMDCNAILPVYGDCKNAKGCALLSVDPSVLLDPVLAKPLLKALADPCDILLKAAASSPAGARRYVNGLHDVLLADISQLKCGERQEFTTKSIQTDPSSGLIRIQF